MFVYIGCLSEYYSLGIYALINHVKQNVKLSQTVWPDLTKNFQSGEMYPVTQKSLATFGLGSSLRILVTNWKKYPCQFHWQRGFLALAMAVRFDRSKLNAIAKAKKLFVSEILCYRFAN